MRKEMKPDSRQDRPGGPHPAPKPPPRERRSRQEEEPRLRVPRNGTTPYRTDPISTIPPSRRSSHQSTDPATPAAARENTTCAPPKTPGAERSLPPSPHPTDDDDDDDDLRNPRARASPRNDRWATSLPHAETRPPPVRPRTTETRGWLPSASTTERRPPPGPMIGPSEDVHPRAEPPSLPNHRRPTKAASSMIPRSPLRPYVVGSKPAVDRSTVSRRNAQRHYPCYP